MIGAACKVIAAAEEEYYVFFSFDYVCLDVLVPTSGVGYHVIGEEQYLYFGYQVFFFYLVLWLFSILFFIYPILLRLYQVTNGGYDNGVFTGADIFYLHNMCGVAFHTLPFSGDSNLGGFINTAEE